MAATLEVEPAPSAVVVDADPRRTGRWAWLVVVVLAVFAGFTYAWQASSGSLELYYQAAVRSMGSSWHDFFFGAFDPAGTITLDKLPGAFWVQALSVRLFGYHPWAIIAPQVVEGVLTVLVLYRAVSRLAGTWAGAVAAAVVAVTPATVALNRGNISDSLLILLLVLAANATVTAVVKANGWWLLVAGLWVGLAFQTKMLQAWLVLPAIALVWLLAGPGRPLRRILQTGASMVVAVVLSLSYLTAVSLVPQANRPYVDGSTHDSMFQMVFSYNGFGRPLSSTTAGINATSFGLRDFRLPGSGLGRLFADAGGRDIGWLLPLALVVAVFVLVARRGEPRDDRLRIATIFWGSWLVVNGAAFCILSDINAYYLAALAPALGALIGIGVEELRRRGLSDSRVRLGVVVGVALTVVYGVVLLDPASVGVRVGIGVGAAAAVVVGWLLLGVGSRHAGSVVGSVLLAAAVVLPSGAAAIAIVSSGLGPFDTPFESASLVQITQVGPRLILANIRPGMELLLTVNARQRYVSAAYTSVVAAPMIIDTGHEFEPIGGFEGSSPAPTLAQLQHQIDTGQLRTVITPPSSDPRIVWIEQHCSPVPRGPSPGINIYFCRP